MAGAAGLGGVDADALTGRALHLQGLGREGERADLRVLERLVGGLASGHFVTLPKAREFGALEEEFADELSEVGGVGGGAAWWPAAGRRRR